MGILNKEAGTGNTKLTGVCVGGRGVSGTALYMHRGRGSAYALCTCGYVRAWWSNLIYTVLKLCEPSRREGEGRGRGQMIADSAFYPEAAARREPGAEYLWEHKPPRINNFLEQFSAQA